MKFFKKALKEEFWVRAEWDEEEKIYYSESNIPGLHIEADSLGIFEDVMFDVAPELIFENVLKPELEKNSFDCEMVDDKTVAVGPKATRVPENVPFVFKGAASRPIQLAMG